jgi:hypothetical protein
LIIVSHAEFRRSGIESAIERYKPRIRHVPRDCRTAWAEPELTQSSIHPVEHEMPRNYSHGNKQKTSQKAASLYRIGSRTTPPVVAQTAKLNAFMWQKTAVDALPTCRLLIHR